MREYGIRPSSQVIGDNHMSFAAIQSYTMERVEALLLNDSFCDSEKDDKVCYYIPLLISAKVSF